MNASSVLNFDNLRDRCVELMAKPHTRELITKLAQESLRAGTVHVDEPIGSEDAEDVAAGWVAAIRMTANKPGRMEYLSVFGRDTPPLHEGALAEMALAVQLKENPDVMSLDQSDDLNLYMQQWEAQHATRDTGSPAGPQASVADSSGDDLLTGSQQNTGVSLYDAALHISEGDASEAKETVKRMIDSKKYPPEILPILGKDPRDNRRKLSKLSKVVEIFSERFTLQTAEKTRLRDYLKTQLRVPTK